MDLVIKNCVVVTGSAIFRGGVAVSDGKIVLLASDPHLPSGNQVIDGKGNFLLPGVVDIHVHFREPGYEYKEDFGTGSKAAAAGGVTTVCDMPSGKPQVDSTHNFAFKARLIQGRSYVDYGLYAMITDENVSGLADVAQAGAIGYKLYMSRTAVQVSIPRDSSVITGFRVAAAAGLPVAVHAENDDLIAVGMEQIERSGCNDILSYAASRPIVAEVEAIQRAALFAQSAGTKVHVLHLSSDAGLDIVKAWKQRGVALTAETCPHYLLLDHDDLERLGSVAKINPPIRPPSDRSRLWQGLVDGTIDVVATDHSPHLPEEKTVPDVWEAAAGFAGVETSVPLMLTQVNRGRLSLQRYIQLACENPAKLLGLYPRKGAIATGADADLILVDMKKETVIHSPDLHSKTTVTPFENWCVQGIPAYTFVRGNPVMRDGEVEDPPRGMMVKETHLAAKA